jgi:hypothetical protein
MKLSAWVLVACGVVVAGAVACGSSPTEPESLTVGPDAGEDVAAPTVNAASAPDAASADAEPVADAGAPDVAVVPDAAPDAPDAGTDAATGHVDAGSDAGGIVVAPDAAPPVDAGPPPRVACKIFAPDVPEYNGVTFVGCNGESTDGLAAPYERLQSGMYIFYSDATTGDGDVCTFESADAYGDCAPGSGCSIGNNMFGTCQ